MPSSEVSTLIIALSEYRNKPSTSKAERQSCDDMIGIIAYRIRRAVGADEYNKQAYTVEMTENGGSYVWAIMIPKAKGKDDAAEKAVKQLAKRDGIPTSNITVRGVYSNEEIEEYYRQRKAKRAQEVKNGV